MKVIINSIIIILNILLRLQTQNIAVYFTQNWLTFTFGLESSFNLIKEVYLQKQINYNDNQYNVYTLSNIIIKPSTFYQPPNQTIISSLVNGLQLITNGFKFMLEIKLSYSKTIQNVTSTNEIVLYMKCSQATFERQLFINQQTQQLDFKSDINIQFDTYYFKPCQQHYKDDAILNKVLNDQVKNLLKIQMTQELTQYVYKCYQSLIDYQQQKFEYIYQGKSIIINNAINKIQLVSDNIQLSFKGYIYDIDNEVPMTEIKFQDDQRQVQFGFTKEFLKNSLNFAAKNYYLNKVYSSENFQVNGFDFTIGDIIAYNPELAKNIEEQKQKIEVDCQINQEKLPELKLDVASNKILANTHYQCEVYRQRDCKRKTLLNVNINAEFRLALTIKNNKLQVSIVLVYIKSSYITNLYLCNQLKQEFNDLVELLLQEFENVQVWGTGFGVFGVEESVSNVFSDYVLFSGNI